MLLSSFLQNANAEQILSVRQIGMHKDSIPELWIANYDSVASIRRNDSTVDYICPSDTVYLYIVIDKKTRWEKRVWMDPSYKKRELIINYSLKTAELKDPTAWDLLLYKVDSLDRKDLFDQEVAATLEYIEKNPDSYSSLWLYAHTYPMTLKTPDEQMAILNKLNPSLKQLPLYQFVLLGTKEKKYAVIGDPFKEFTLADPSGKVFNSSSVNNKWILLHFWSTNCGPCIREMDELVSFYTSLDTSKTAFISVSMDIDQARWKKSSVTAKMKWASVWQPDNSYGELCLHYNVNAMPFFILFNKEKKIHLITFGAGELGLIKDALREAKE